MNWLGQPVALAFGWALVHFLWQGTLVALLLSLLLRLLRNASARVRHFVACAAMLACLVFPALTLNHHWPQPSRIMTQSGIDSVDSPLIPSLRLAQPSTNLGTRIEQALRPALPWMVAIWMLGCLFLLLRLGGGWLWLNRMRSRHSDSAPMDWQKRFQNLARRLGLRRCPILRVSTRVEGPMAHGWWKPTVLIPASLVTGMNSDLLEALLAHELAHILRQDYLANLLQCLCETLLFYHPAVWWISAKIRTTREEACDDLAAKAIGEPRRLALALAELDLFQLPAPALGAHQGDLMHRIQRLVKPSQPRLPFGGLLPLLLAASLLSPVLASTLEKPVVIVPILRPATLIAQLDALAAKEGIDPNLLRAIAETESHFDPNAMSPNGSMGLLQVMPATARKYGAQNLQDPAQVMAAGARYLRFLLDRYQGDWNKAIAAYNGGEEASDSGKMSEETRRYLPTVLRLAKEKAVQPDVPSETPTVGTPRESSTRHLQPKPNADTSRRIHLARHNGKLTLEFSLTRSELATLLAENWNWLFTNGAEDRSLTLSYPALRADQVGGVDANLKGVSPEDFLRILAKQGATPEPLSEAWLKQLPAATATGEMKRLKNDEWEVDMQVITLDGFDVEFRVDGTEKPVGKITVGDAARRAIVRFVSHPKIRTEIRTGKSLTVRITERSTSRYGETTVDLTPDTANFRVVMDKNEKS
ncbi:MAG: M56 family metallopeptidase [Holophaga sp.]|nr:M56 family metallopeptidase [Holophaga sp.]